MADDQTPYSEAPLRGVVAHAAAGPQRTALVLGENRRSYGELVYRAQKLAVVLKDRGAQPGQTIASVLPNGFEAFEVALAAAMLGAPYLPINWHLKASELSYLFADAAPIFVIGHAGLAKELSGALGEHPEVRSLLVGGDYEEEVEEAFADPELDAGPGPELVFYTSGTTARPKGVVHSRLGEIDVRRAGMEGQAQLWGWHHRDVYVMSGPAYHAAHAGWGLAALYVGARVILLEKFDALEFLGAIETHRATRSFMVPSHFIRILELDDKTRHRFDTSSFSLVVHGGAPCPIAIKRKMIEEFPKTEFHELYGASEGGATRISPREWLERPGSVGLPWPGVAVKVLDEHGNDAATGEDGVIWIKPQQKFSFTYRNDPEATANAWRDDAFTVGDIGHLDDAGYLTITDRVSDMVLWGGVNIAPREIEEVLFGHPAVIDCAVFGIPDERDGQHLKALVEVRSPVATEELADFVRERLADYKVPHVIELVTELPRDPNGKIMKRLLR